MPEQRPHKPVIVAPGTWRHIDHHFIGLVAWVALGMVLGAAGAPRWVALLWYSLFTAWLLGLMAALMTLGYGSCGPPEKGTETEAMKTSADP